MSQCPRCGLPDLSVDDCHALISALGDSIDAANGEAGARRADDLRRRLLVALAPQHESFAALVREYPWMAQ